MRTPLLSLRSLSTLLVLASATPLHADCPPRRLKNIPKEAHWCNGSWFQVIDGNTPWKDAKKKCEAAGGNLAVIPDQATWTALKPFIPDSDFWLGATDEEEEGKWRWVDGSSLTFAPWRAGEPNNVNNAEHYLVSSWGDVPENYGWTKGYVCQWKGFEALMAYRADVEDSNPEVASVLKLFRAEIAPAIQAHHAGILAADGVYATALLKEVDAASKRNDADLVVALQKEIAQIKKEAMIPSEDPDNSPPALVKLRKTYREQCWKVYDERNRKAPPVVRKYDPYLDKIQAKLLKDGAVNKALEVKAIRQSMQSLLKPL